MGNQITALVQAASGKDFISEQGEFGEKRAVYEIPD